MTAVLTENRDGVLDVALNRPDSLNAINQALIEGLDAALDAARGDDVRCVLLRGEGPGFCAGGDVKYFGEMIRAGNGIPRELPDTLHHTIENICRLPRPVVAVVHGPCAGAGVSLVMACDLAIAADDARFTLAYTRIGLSPDGSASYFLPRHVGMKKATELLMLSQRLTADEVLALGLVNRVVPADAVLREGRALARTLADGPTAAFARVKQLVSASYGNDLHDQLALESELICASSMTEDFREGVMSFLQKRAPRFKGR